MKTLKLIALSTLFALLAFACSEADREEFTKDLTDELQLKFLESDEIEKAFDIDGATFETGDATEGKTQSFSIEAPQPIINNAKDTASFSFSTDEPLDGVYTQLVTTNGTKADRYFDIPITSLENNGTEYTFDLSLADLTEEELEEVPVGEICLLFSGYKGSQDVSNPLTGCTRIDIGEDGEKEISKITFE